MDALTQFQLDIEARIKADPYFSDITVLAESRGVSDEDITQSLATQIKNGGKKGAAVIILMPVRAVPDQNIPGPSYRLTFVVQTMERPLINIGTGGTGKPAEEISLAVEQLLHHASIQATYKAIVHTATGAFTFENGDKVYESVFTTDLRRKQPAKAALPVISGPASAVQITCATGGVTIYYTTNGTYPALHNAAATPYSVPLNLSPGTLVRAAAYKENTQGSDIAAMTINN